MSQRRALQAATALACLVPVSAGLAGIVAGPSLVGAQEAGPALTSHFAYLSGLLLGIGIAFFALVPRIETHGTVFRTLAAIVAVGGLARLSMLVLHGWPTWPHVLALAMELVVTPALAIWQARVARAAMRQPVQPG